MDPKKTSEPPREGPEGREATPLATGVVLGRERGARTASDPLGVRGLAHRLGRALGEHCDAVGLGRFEVAERAGVPVHAVRAVERGDWTNLRLFFRLCRAAEVRHEDLLCPPRPGGPRMHYQGVLRNGAPFARDGGPVAVQECFRAVPPRAEHLRVTPIRAGCQTCGAPLPAPGRCVACASGGR